MALSILISEPDIKWADEMKSTLEKHSFAADVAQNGKDCQLLVYKNKYMAVVLDLDTQNNTGLEVLRYLRLNAPSVKVILTLQNKTRLTALELTKEDLRKLGASDILIKPYTQDILLKSIEGVNQFESWKEIKKAGPQKEEETVDIHDNEFTRIKLEDFYSGNSTVFDCYIRLSKNKYVRILHKGDFFEKSRIKKYVVEKEITHLYFKTKERSAYINFINEVLGKMVQTPQVDAEKKS